MLLEKIAGCENAKPNLLSMRINAFKEKTPKDYFISKEYVHQAQKTLGIDAYEEAFTRQGFIGTFLPQYWRAYSNILKIIKEKIHDNE